MPPELKTRLELEAEEKKVLEEEKRLEAEERQVQREVFRKCGHDYEDVTEERHALLEGRELPGWIKHLIEERDRKWMGPRESWRSSKYEKCTGCGLLKVSNIIDVG